MTVVQELNCPEVITQLRNNTHQYQMLANAAQRRGIELHADSEPHKMFAYDEDPMSKRQFFWLSYISKCLATLPDNQSLLDIGSNISWLIGLAAHHEITMVDVRHHPLQNIFPFKFQQANAIHLPFPDNSFKVVTFPQVLHWVGTGTYGDELNIDGDQHAVNEIARVLEPNGLGIFSTFVVSGKTVFKLGGRRLFALSDLKQLLHNAHLTIETLNIYNAACEPIAADDIPALSSDRIMPGYPDEELAWVMGIVRLSH